MKLRSFGCAFFSFFASTLLAQPTTRVAAYAALPQGFEANIGQTDSRVRFLAHGQGVGMFFTPSEVVWSLSRREGKAAEVSNSVVRMKLLDANAKAVIAGVHLLPGRSNYILGKDRTQWRSNVPRYEKVQYRNLYPGVDLVFYRGSEQRLEFDFVVAPGADPGKIQMSLEGAGAMSIDGSGDLVLRTPAGDIRTKAPRVYQQSDGIVEELSGRYVLAGNRVSFRVGAYDHSRPLVIDPVVTYATYLGGNGTDVGQDVGEDAAGNLYVAGITASANFPATAGAAQRTFHGVEDAFVTKLNVQTGIVYSTYIGGSGDDQARSMAVDSEGNVYITGPTNSSDFPTTAGAFQMTGGGNCGGSNCAHAFVFHLDPSGALVYSTYLGSTPGTGSDVTQGIAIDAAGNAYVAGTTNSPSFPTTPGAYRRMSGGGICGGIACPDAFVAKLNPSGAALVYSTYLAGSSEDFGTGIAVDASGNAFVTGSTSSSDFPTTPGAYQTSLKAGTCNGMPCDDSFIAALNPTGSGLVYSTFLGGTGADDAFDIDVDASGQAYVIGTTGSKDFPTTAGAFQTTYGGGTTDVFVTALNSTGTALVASTYLGGSGTDTANGISISDSGEIILAIDTTSANLPQEAAPQSAAASSLATFNTSASVGSSDPMLRTYRRTDGGRPDESRRKARKRHGRTCSTGGVGPTNNLPTTSGVPGPRFGGGDADVALLCTQDTATQPALQASPQSLTFNAIAGGPPPGSQSLAISSTSGQPVGFSITIDTGAPTVASQEGSAGSVTGTPTPAWLTVTPSSGTTPALVIVSVNQNQAPLTNGTFTARIVIGVPTSSQQQVAVTVKLIVTNAPPQLAVAPNSLSFRSTEDMPGTFSQTIVVQNAGGGGAQNFTVSMPAPVSWIDSISPMSGRTAPNSPAFVVVKIKTNGLSGGGYRTTIVLVSNGATIPVTISLFVAKAGPILGVSQTGLFFQSRQGQGLRTAQTLEVLDFGDPSSSIAFAATIANKATWLSISQTAGTATPAQPKSITATVNANALTLAVGVYYALVQITDTNAEDSPQYVVVVLQVLPDTTPPAPDPFPRGLVFIAAPGGVLPAPQMVTVYTSSSADVAFQASASGAAFLTVSPASGMLATQFPATLNISVNISGVSSGVYQGSINISIGGVFVSVDVTIIVLPPGNFSASRAGEPLADTPLCMPSRVVLTQTGLASGFSVPGGFPATLAVLMNDDCGKKITDGSVTASFSNGDPAIVLRSDMATGMYSATWQPSIAAQQITVTANGTSGALKAGSVQITGTIGQNQAPVLAHGGTVNNAYPTGALSPGVVAQVFGADLASTSASPGVVPLLTEYQGTSLLVGTKSVPLFFVSSGQVNVQIPAELNPGQYQIIANFDGALTLPDTIDVNALGPGIVALADGHVIAQHSNGKLVKSTNPAKPGETLVIYLVGMGATNPAVASGHAASSNPLAKAVVQPVVTVDGQKAKVPFAGLTPGGVGLYQIDFTVPASARNGDLDLIITQNGVAGNTTKLTVAK